MDGDDCVAYRDFIAAPGPERTGPRNAQRWSEAWRPFEGPLSPHSSAAAMTNIRLMREGMVQRRYSDSKPCCLAILPALGRLRFVLDFAYMTGMRLAELAAAKFGRLRHEQFDDGEWACSVVVLGKRHRWREAFAGCRFRGAAAAPSDAGSRR